MTRGGALGIGLAFLAVVSLVRARDCAPRLLRNAFAAQTLSLVGRRLHAGLLSAKGFLAIALPSGFRCARPGAAP